jgi:hypothetical protein
LTLLRVIDAGYAKGYLGQAGLLPGLSAFGQHMRTAKRLEVDSRVPAKAFAKACMIFKKSGRHM